MTTINNSHLIEKVGGIERAKKIVEGAPDWANGYNTVIQQYVRGVWFSRDFRLDDLRTAIAKHDATDIGTEIDSFLDAFKSPELTDERKQELTQDWKGMSGGVAFSLIERHADNWKEIDYMMNQWLEANKEAERHG